MKKIFFFFFLISSIIFSADIIYLDDFEDGNLDIIDEKLKQGLSWEVFGNTLISSSENWKDKLLKLDRGTKIISKQKILVDEFTLTFDILNYYTTPVKIKFFYIDEENFYYFEPSKGILGKVLNRQEKKLSDKISERYLSIHRANPAKANYKIYFKNMENQILIKIDKDGYLNGEEYEFSYKDTDKEAINLFKKNGRISISEEGSGNYNYWVWFDNIKIYSGLYKTTPPREPKIIYVDKEKGDDLNSGDKDKPLKTIQKAIEISIPNDKIIVRKGDYNEKISFKPDRIYALENKPLIIKSEEKHKSKVLSFDLKYGDYITIDGFEIIGSSILIGGSKGVKVINCFIHDLKGQVGIVVDGENGYVAGNYILRCNKGIVVAGKNNLVENNEIERLIYENQDADYFRVFGEGHIIRNNYMHGTKREEIGPSHTDGFQTFDNNGEYLRHTIIEGNFIEDFYAQGFMGEGGIYYHSYDITFRNNIFKDAGAWGLCISSIKDVKVYNNIFINLGIHGVGFTYRDPSKPSSGEVYNNIFYNGGNFYWASKGCDVKGGNNILFSTHSFIDPSRFPNDIVNKDPLFINIGKKDYHLHPLSPAINSGKELSPYFTDKEGKERKDNWDIGPYEFQGSDKPCAYITFKDEFGNISTKGYEPYRIYFSGLLSYAPSGRKIVEYCWDFNDGTEKVFLPECEHLFKEGNYNIVLSVKDDKGEKSQSELNIEVMKSIYPYNYLKINFEDTYSDLSGKNVKVRWNGNPDYREGIKGKSGYFDNKNSRSITISHNDYFDGINQFTWSFWIKKNNPKQRVTILTKHTVYKFQLTENGFSIDYLSGEKSSLSLSSEKLNIDNNWHHYLITYDGKKVILYFDGEKVSEKPFNERIRRDRSRDIVIGQDPWGDSLDGFIDEINFYNIGLTYEQIIKLYKGEEPF
ncbi:MAG: right-handed parallel beta-helix repeat-containing protein [Candidatus Omnitrophica bacterium]|nr:right-handed parallel beta-helix repeat-containing protein [Candidatus Omnitrophota bacterium]